MTLFSERYGYTAKQAFQREVVSPDLRTGLWNVLKLCVWDFWEDYEYEWTVDSQRINRMVERLWLHYLKADIDDLPPFHYPDSRKGAYDVLKDNFFRCEWYELFNFIEFLAKDKESFFSADVQKLINNTLEHENSAYRLIGREIVEITDKNQIDAIQKALEIPVPPVRAHLNSALAMLSEKNAPDYRNSIKESISAVEAACREISGQPKATLGDALKKVAGLHPALKAFSNLYGYTNDADGIRHALLDEPSLTKEDATFMLVACSAFVGFLYEKAKT
jgi:hypothetical protein